MHLVLEETSPHVDLSTDPLVTYNGVHTLTQSHHEMLNYTQ